MKRIASPRLIQKWRLVFWLGVFMLGLVSRVPAQQLPGLRLLQGPELLTLTNDIDGDGLPDFREMLLGTNPQSPDTDMDGFSDLFEDTYRQFGFDPLTPSIDSDGDGLTDQFEDRIGTNPFDPDTDHDGYTDFDEVWNREFGFDPRVSTLDSDFDGLSDDLEARLGTNPANPDTDNDGLNDFEEFAAGFDPTTPDSRESVGELLGVTYSQAMADALVSLRAGNSFPSNLVAQLPFPEISQRFYGRPPVGRGPAPSPAILYRPSAALIQLAILDPLVARYSSYNTVVQRLIDIANQFNGSLKPNIARLYFWSEPTTDKRYIYILKISDNPAINENETEILFMAMHHARELITPSIIMGFINELTDKYAAGDVATHNLVDNNELWFIPLVNPDGYSMGLSEYGKGLSVNWRKNTRKVAELTPGGSPQSDSKRGVDPNRNYGFEHIRTFPAVYRSGLSALGKDANGLDSGGNFDPNNECYAGAVEFSDVEARAVRGLVNDRSLLDGCECSLSWHSYGGEVTYPMGHTTADGLRLGDRPRLDALSDAFAAATGYTNLRDTWATVHYPTYADSDDWLYKAKAVLAMTVEAYSASERKSSGPQFFPDTFEKQSLVVSNNIRGARAFISACDAYHNIISIVDYRWFHGLFQLSFPTRPGSFYLVEYKNSLNDNQWSGLREVPGDGQTATVEDTTGLQQPVPRRFYRVRKLQGAP